MKRFKCWNCPDARGLPGYEFEAETPACPKCKLDPKVHPEGKGLIIEVQPHHFIPPHPVIKARGTGKRACDGKPVGTDGHPCTGEPMSVTCSACRATEVFVKTAEEWGVAEVVAERDYVLTDPEKKSV